MSTAAKKDRWVCHILRSEFHAIAADDRLRARDRVWAALWAAMYSDGDHLGEGSASLRSLQSVTRLSRATVRRVVDELVASSVLAATKGPKGSRRARSFTLSARTGDTEDSAGRGAPSVPDGGHRSVPDGGHTVSEDVTLSTKREKDLADLLMWKDEWAKNKRGEPSLYDLEPAATLVRSR